MTEEKEPKRKDTISRTEYLLVEGLVMLAKKHQAITDDCIESIEGLLPEGEDWIRDLIFTDLDVKTGLGRMGIEVEG